MFSLPSMASTMRLLRGRRQEQSLSSCYGCHGCMDAFVGVIEDRRVWQDSARIILPSLVPGNQSFACVVCSQLYQLIIRNSDSRVTDGHRLWRNEVTLPGNGFETQRAMYFNLEIRADSREIWIVPRNVCPPRYPYGMARSSILMGSANGWMSECRLYHHGTCKNIPRKHSMSLRVIDCTARVLCTLPENSPYVCLSYVWGPFSSHGSSQGDLQNLPRTMEDAIQATILLGLRYLWIDRYCIDQANAAEKHEVISSMGVIYQGAEVTIIAVAGVGPHAGLPGIGETSFVEENLMSINGIWHATFLNPRLEISKAAWSSRGWTYQEMLLSRRRLVFTPSQLYFQCNYMHCGNLMSAKFSKATGSTAPARAFPQMQNASAEDYIFERLREYYIRRLSYPSDIVNAFMGVIGAFSLSRLDRNLRASQFYGIPLLYLDADESGRKYPVATKPAMPRITFLAGLAWSILGTERWPLQTTSNDTFPSWTWASVKSNRGDSDCGNLEFPVTSQSDYVSNTRVYIHHRSKGRREIRGHVDEWSHHEIYYPWIDLESWTAPSALIPEPGIGPRSRPLSYRLSGFKGGTLSFDYGVQNQAMGTATVVLLGEFHLYADPGVAIFLVLADNGGGLYRRIGLYTSVRHEREFAMDRLAKMMTPRFAVQKRSASLDEQNRSEAARERLVQEERTWQRRVVRVI